MGSRMLRAWLIGLCVVAGAFGWSEASAGERITELSIKETAGIVRNSAGVTAGIPLAKGRIKSLGELALSADGRRVECQWREVAKWWSDGSLRWVAVDFVTDLAAGAKKSFTLEKVADGPAASGKPLAVETAESITVTTGPLKFIVRKAGFNVINEAWVDASGAGKFNDAGRVIAPHDRGVIFTSEGKEYRAVADADCKVVIQENGPVKCLITATGSHKNGSEKRTDFMVRITAYKGCPDVSITYAWINRQGKRTDMIPLDDLSLELPTVLKGNLSFQLGNQKSPITGKLAAGKDAWCFQKDMDTCQFGGLASGNSAGGEKEDLETTGWGSIDNGTVGVSVGRRWFWQMYPADVTVSNTAKGGLIRLGLYSKRGGEPTQAYTGAARTHYVILSFFATANRRRQATRFANLVAPLRLFATPAYYCEQTRGLGNFAQSEKRLFGEQEWKAIKHMDQRIAESLARVVTGRRHFKGGNAYGYRYFMDFIHHKGSAKRKQKQWDGNYYDFPHACLTQWLRTGNRKLWRMFEETVGHTQDIHLVHYDRKIPGNRDSGEVYGRGASRKCPSKDQVGDPPYVSHSFNHWHVQCLVDRYLLLGDRWAEDVAMMALNHTLVYKSNDSHFGSNPRGPGHQLIGMICGYMLTGNKKFLSRCAEVVPHGYRWQTKHEAKNGLALYSRWHALFQQGICMGSFIEYFKHSRDEKLLKSVARNIEAMKKVKGANSSNYRKGSWFFHGFESSAYALAFLGRYYKNDEYYAMAVDTLQNVRRLKKTKNIGMAFRYVALASYVLSKLADEDPIFKKR